MRERQAEAGTSRGDGAREVGAGGGDDQDLDDVDVALPTMARRRLSEVMRLPLAVAPMAGGPSVPELSIAAAEAGALGFVAGGYKSVEALSAEIATVRAATSEAFGVNLFVPGEPTADSVALGRYLESLAPEAESLGVVLGEAVFDDDGFDAKVAALLHDPPPVVSFTFGCPDAEVLAAFGDVGSTVVVTVTCPEEAERAIVAGADALCVQGVEAGAHRGSFADGDGIDRDYLLVDLIRAVGSATELPVIGAGGIMDPKQMQAVLDAGAVAAQCGTAFLRCPESGAHRLHKDALASGRHPSTALTRAFSGRVARGLVNRFVSDHPDAPSAYPEINSVTRPLRAAAAARGDTEMMSLWAGTGFAAATDHQAGEVITWLWPGRPPHS